MAEQWPGALPWPVNMFDGQQVDVAVRTGEQFGVGTARRRMTNAPANVSLSLVLNDDERAYFETFYYQNTGNGAAYFTANWLPFVKNSGHHAARIRSYRSILIAPGLWRVEFDIEAIDSGIVVDGYQHPWFDEGIA